MITRDDVAKAAGVSKSTVSRVLNSTGYVSPENRRKIETAIDKLGYKPNLIARSLKTKETRQILFYAAELTNPFYVEVYEGMEEFARQNSYTIVVSRHFDHSMIQQRQFDGIVLSGVSPESQDEFLQLGIPMVVTDYSCQALKIPAVSIDMQEGALKAVEHLVQNGHRDIAFITNVASREDLRFQGYLNGLMRSDIAAADNRILYPASGRNAYEQGYITGKELAGRAGEFTAVFAFNDAMAIGAMAALREKSLKIPENVSFIGFDDILQSQYTAPPLSTIHIPKYEQGWESAKMLFRLMKEEKVEPLVLKTELKVRQSVMRLPTPGIKGV